MDETDVDVCKGMDEGWDEWTAEEDEEEGVNVLRSGVVVEGITVLLLVDVAAVVDDEWIWGYDFTLSSLLAVKLANISRSASNSIDSSTGHMHESKAENNVHTVQNKEDSSATFFFVFPFDG